MLLSACMMVKNEEANLDRCLRSLENVVDEIIVVDTGSEDRTLEIAESYGARIYHHPWQNNFSLHRNQSIGYAGGKWVFIVDADEELVLSDGVKPADVRRWLKSSVPKNFVSCAVTLDDIQRKMVAMQFNTARLFLRGKVRYRGVVHNKPVIDGAANSVHCPLFRLRHYGYDLTPEQKKAKEIRTRGLLEQRLEDNPEDYECYFYLSQMAAADGKSVEACEHAEKYLAAKDKLETFNPTVFYSTAHHYVKQGRRDDAMRWLRQGLEHLPGDLDLHLLLVEFGVWQQRPEVVYLGAERYLELYEAYQKNPASKGSRFTYSFNPEALCYVLHQRAISAMRIGIRDLTNLYKSMPYATEKYRKALKAELEQQLQEIGCHGLNVVAETPAVAQQSRRLNFGGVAV